MYADEDVQLQPIDRRKYDQYNYISEDDDFDVSSDEERADKRKAAQATKPPQDAKSKDWNDIPDDFLKAPPKGKLKKTAPSAEERKKKQAQEWDDWGQ
jgi:palmitoyltransferase